MRSFRKTRFTDNFGCRKTPRALKKTVVLPYYIIIITVIVINPLLPVESSRVCYECKRLEQFILTTRHLLFYALFGKYNNNKRHIHTSNKMHETILKSLPVKSHNHRGAGGRRILYTVVCHILVCVHWLVEYQIKYINKRESRFYRVS